MIQLFRYSIPFHSPFQTGERVWTERNGCLIHYRDDRLEALTETAPLPGYSGESLDEVIQLLRNRHREIDELLSAVRSKEAFRHRLGDMKLPPSVEFGISAAWISLTARRTETSIHDWFETSLNPSILVNTTLGIGMEADLLTKIAERSDAGFRVIKFKCGIEPGDLPDILARAAGRHPELTFRIDANQKWPLHRASGYLNRFNGLPVEYCEEPFGWNSASELMEFRNSSPVPVALDESVCSPERLMSALQNRLADFYIIKPMLFGSIFDLLETLFQGGPIVNNPNIIFSSSFESAVGRSITTWLAGMAGSRSHAHGLDTGRLFRQDLTDTGSAAVIRPGSARNWEIPLAICNSDHITPIPNNGN